MKFDQGMDVGDPYIDIEGQGNRSRSRGQKKP